MAHLCDDYRESALWSEAFALAETAMQALANQDHPLTGTACELTARIPAALAQAATAPDADITDALTRVLDDLVLLEHYGALAGFDLPADALSALKGRLLDLLEDEDFED